ncbi:DOMON-like domain-containing protein [Sphingomonas sp. LaA6.9]|uniref:DOMON-like domain-containing protein n=1 Tax=Sphingomonas sp. LaA6.9 TaxID=2919914 RepID=UPI001F4F3D32|nr:DOMON-like domain-containing protein [Sphingomonas sp. LaA6.9]MCJ8156166.1 DOMON-like domain-containing protein [Sphingomonas sp. LaA6.9]
MRLALQLHPESRCRAITRIEVDLACDADMLTLEFQAIGRIADLRIPNSATPVRRDGLWQHSCFEAFVAAGGVYHEFNFAPSAEWAAYGFSGYRTGMRDLDIAAPAIQLRAGDELLALTVSLALADLPERNSAQWQLGLSAIIEESDGNKSYWALAHAPGKPDFHHPDCFAHPLAGQ